MPFPMLDPGTAAREGDGLTASRAVTDADDFLDDHFPGFPILPGVMMLEALVQAASAWVDAAGLRPAEAEPLIVAEVKKVTYAAMVRKGETLEVSVELKKHEDGDRFTFQGTGRVGGREAVKGRFVLVPAVRPAVG